MEINKNGRKPTDTPVDFTKHPIPTLDTTNFGHNIKRTMHLLSSSTPEKPNKVRIAYCGQSIVDPNNTWPATLSAWLRKQYPSAQIVDYNFAIGGFATEFLRKRMPNDIRSFYPDLVIIYVSGSDTHYEEMVRFIRENTGAEIMIHTSHLSRDPGGFDWSEAMSYTHLPKIAEKYGAQMVDTRTPWKNFLLKNLLPVESFIYDDAHLNASGQEFMYQIMNQQFVLRESNAAAEIAAQYIPVSPSDWQNGVLTVPFTGNRVELVYGSGTRAAVQVQIDDKKPSEILDAYIRTISNNGMWSTIGDIGYKKIPGEQEFTIKITSFTDQHDYTYTAEDPQGCLNLTDMSFIFHPGADKPEAGQEYTFGSMLNGTDVHDGTNPYESHPDKKKLFDPMMLVSGITNGAHVLKLTATQAVPDIVAIKVYNPKI